MSLDLHTNSNQLQNSYHKTLNTPNHYSLFTISTNTTTNNNSGSGTGTGPVLVLTEEGYTLESLQESLNDSKLQIAFIHLHLDSQSKYVLISWTGDGVPIIHKAQMPSYLNQVKERLVKGFHLEIHARTEVDVDSEVVMRKVRDAKGAKYGASERSGVSSQSVGSQSVGNAAGQSAGAVGQSVGSRSTEELRKERVDEDQRLYQREVELHRQREINHSTGASTTSTNTNTTLNNERYQKYESKPLTTNPTSTSTTSTRSIWTEREKHASLESLSHTTKNSSKGNTPEMLRKERMEREREEREREQRRQLEQEQRQKEQERQEESKKEEQVREERQRELERQRQEQAKLRQQEQERQEQTKKEEQERQRQQLERQRQVQEQEQRQREQEEQKRQKEQQRKREEEEKERLLAKQREHEEQQKQRQAKQEEQQSLPPTTTTTPNNTTTTTTNNTATVLYSYEAQEENELSIQEGQLIHNIKQLDEGWWSGDLLDSQGVVLKSGLFPSNYVELISTTTTTSTTNTDIVTNSNKCNIVGSGLNDPNSGFTVIALYSYDAQEDNEISFREGEMIEKVQQVTEEWWSGQNQQGKMGLFPYNYVERV